MAEGLSAATFPPALLPCSQKWQLDLDQHMASSHHSWDHEVVRPKLVAQGQALPQALGTGLHGGLQGPNRAFTVLGALMNSCRLLFYSENSMNLYAREKSWFLELSAKSPPLLGG